MKPTTLRMSGPVLTPPPGLAPQNVAVSFRRPEIGSSG
jgi:hypothetical protein